MQFNFLKKISYNLLILAISFILVVVLIYLPTNINTRHCNDKLYEDGVLIGEHIVSFDNQRFVDDVVDYLKMIGSGSLGQSRWRIPVQRFVETSFKRTMRLLLISLSISIVFGILKGVYDSRKKNKHVGNIKLMSTISFLSIPDIFLVMVFQALAVWLYKHNMPIFSVVGGDSFKAMVLPVLSLSIMPLHYVARVTTVSIENIYKKQYIITAIGKGASNIRILWIHIFRNAIVEILGSFSSLVAILISSLLLIEYMYSYPGLAFMMFEYSRDTKVIIVCAMILAIIYFVIDLIFSAIRFLITPVSEKSL